MPFPPSKKTMEGLLQDITIRLTLVERRLAIRGGGSTTPAGPLLGEVKIIAANIAPPSWIIADGRAVSRTQWPQLFARIGTTHGGGDGSTTFNVPNLRPPVLQGPPRPIAFIIYGGRFTP